MPVPTPGSVSRGYRKECGYGTNSGEKVPKILIVGLTSGSPLEWNPELRVKLPRLSSTPLPSPEKGIANLATGHQQARTPSGEYTKWQILPTSRQTKDLSRLVHRAPQIIKAKYRQGRHGQPSDINEVVYRCYRYPRPSPGQISSPLHIRGRRRRRHPATPIK